jgi:hypothetical protein
MVHSYLRSVIWVLSVAILSILLFNEGLSFVETARSTTKEYFKTIRIHCT